MYLYGALLTLWVLANTGYCGVANNLYKCGEVQECTWCFAPRFKRLCEDFCNRCDNDSKTTIEPESTTQTLYPTTPTTQKPYRDGPVIPMYDANIRYRTCCDSLPQLPKGCLPLCRYDVSLIDLQKYIFSGQCSLENTALLLYCANDGEDNRRCCEYKGYTSKYIRPQCQDFCSDDPNRIGSLKPEHKECAIWLPPIMICHWFGLEYRFPSTTTSTSSITTSTPSTTASSLTLPTKNAEDILSDSVKEVTIKWERDDSAG